MAGDHWTTAVFWGGARSPRECAHLCRCYQRNDHAGDVIYATTVAAKDKRVSVSSTGSAGSGAVAMTTPGWRHVHAVEHLNACGANAGLSMCVHACVRVRVCVCVCMYADSSFDAFFRKASVKLAASGEYASPVTKENRRNSNVPEGAHAPLSVLDHTASPAAAATAIEPVVGAVVSDSPNRRASLLAAVEPYNDTGRLQLAQLLRSRGPSYHRVVCNVHPCRPMIHGPCHSCRDVSTSPNKCVLNTHSAYRCFL